VSAWLLLALTGLAAGVQAECADLPAAGNILVATQSAPDPDFARTVILIVHSGEEGVMGFILNRPSGFPVSHLFPETKSTAAGEAPLYLGGFVAQGVRAVLRSSSPPRDARRLFNDVWLILNAAQVEQLARAGARPPVFRAYAGYAGWSQGQLRRELLLGLWRVVPGSAAAVFDPHPETLWKRLSTSQR
jgi:putative transcriptional regulator